MWLSKLWKSLEWNGDMSFDASPFRSYHHKLITMKAPHHDRPDHVQSLPRSTWSITRMRSPIRRGPDSEQIRLLYRREEFSKWPRITCHKELKLDSRCAGRPPLWASTLLSSTEAIPSNLNTSTLRIDSSHQESETQNCRKILYSRIPFHIPPHQPHHSSAAPIWNPIEYQNPDQPSHSDAMQSLTNLCEWYRESHIDWIIDRFYVWAGKYGKVKAFGGICGNLTCSGMWLITCNLSCNLIWTVRECDIDVSGSFSVNLNESGVELSYFCASKIGELGVILNWIDIASSIDREHSSIQLVICCTNDNFQHILQVSRSSILTWSCGSRSLWISRAWHHSIDLLSYEHEDLLFKYTFISKRHRHSHIFVCRLSRWESSALMGGRLGTNSGSISQTTPMVLAWGPSKQVCVSKEKGLSWNVVSWRRWFQQLSSWNYGHKGAQ